jgi:hypothetical protein
MPVHIDRQECFEQQTAITSHDRHNCRMRDITTVVDDPFRNSHYNGNSKVT